MLPDRPGPSKVEEDAREKDLYIRALRALDKHGMDSDLHRVATLPQEIDLMRSTNVQVTKFVSQFSYREGQYEQIFEREKA